MTPAVIKFPEKVIKGNSIPSFRVALKADGIPMDIASAKATLFTRNGKWVYDWTVTLEGNGSIMCGVVTPAETEVWPSGELYLFIEVTLGDGSVITPIKGVVVVNDDFIK